MILIVQITMKKHLKSDLPRERMRTKGVQALSLEELVAILLQVGSSKRNVLKLSKHLVKKVNQRWKEITLEGLLKIDGIGLSKACKVIAAIELGKRVLENNLFQIRSSHDIIPLLQDIKDREQEHFVIFTLNGNGNVIRRHTISQGSINSLLVHPREVFLPAIRDNAASIIAAHNHPSGSLEASPEDILLTKKIKSVGRILGIPLLDHVIVTSLGWTTA